MYRKGTHFISPGVMKFPKQHVYQFMHIEIRVLHYPVKNGDLRRI